MSSKNILLLLLLIATIQSYSQITGCTDPLSKNYNPLATKNDGSCNYVRKRVKPNFSARLSPILKETSSLLLWDSLLWTANDDSDTSLYAMDTTGVIQKEIPLKKISNTDWEDMSQDSLYFYIGDFGNNVSGNRKDLHILRIEKESLRLNVQKIDTLSFSYSDQTDFSKSKPNTTNFDCEALIVLDDSIYLFTKQWKQKRTAVYALAKTPGNHVAQYKESYNINGLITGATYVPHKKVIALTGYSKRLSPFIYLLYDYNNNSFFSGNKRKIKIALPFHQVEGITTQDGLRFYLTNENFVRKPIINSPQRFHIFDLSSLLSP